jgi:hypothetical protein
MHGAGDVLRHILLQERDGRPRRDVHRPRIGLDHSGDQPHQRRLPGAVAAEQADSLPGLDVAGHVIEQRRTAKAKRQVAKRDKRHEATEGNETRGPRRCLSSSRSRPPRTSPARDKRCVWCPAKTAGRPASPPPPRSGTEKSPPPRIQLQPADRRFSRRARRSA